MRLNRTEDGLITVTDRDTDMVICEVKTLRCCHCGGHFPAKPPKDPAAKFYTAEEARARQAQGKTLRGWCLNCQGPVCGPGCSACVPLEQQLENIEKGRPADHRPIVASVPRAIGG